MPRYNYICNKCANKAMKKHSVEDPLSLPQDVLECDVLFETSHAINPTDSDLLIAKKCPRCGSTDSEITLYGSEIHSYIRGYGWLDRDGAKRDMNLHTLNTADPYKEHRVPGEADHIRSELKKQGQHDSKPKYFSKVTTSDVSMAVRGNK